VSYSLALDRLINDAMVRLPGALEDQIKRELFNTLDEFFTNSNIWREDISVTTEVGEDTYILGQSEPGTILRLMWLYDANQTPVNATMSEPGKLVLTNTPSAVMTLTATVSLTVTDPTTTDNFPLVPDWSADRYALNWLDGVLGRMMSQKSKPYFDKELAVFHWKRFSNAIALARAEAQHNNVFRVQAWRFPQTFAVQRRRG
jgi:hypothetical protein